MTSPIIVSTCLVPANLTPSGKPVLLHVKETDLGFAAVIATGASEKVLALFKPHQRQEAIFFAVDYAVGIGPMMVAVNEDRLAKAKADARDAGIAWQEMT